MEANMQCHLSTQITYYLQKNTISASVEVRVKITFIWILRRTRCSFFLCLCYIARWNHRFLLSFNIISRNSLPFSSSGKWVSASFILLYWRKVLNHKWCFLPIPVLLSIFSVMISFGNTYFPLRRKWPQYVGFFYLDCFEEFSFDSCSV